MSSRWSTGFTAASLQDEEGQKTVQWTVFPTNGYTGYNRLTLPTRTGGAPVTLAYCWAHARREFIEATPKAGSPLADEALRRIAQIYAIEAEIRGRPAEERRAVRQARSAPLAASLHA